jgi:transposase, IS5 family
VPRTAERQVSFADWELLRQGLRLEPLLQSISDLLDDQQDMIEQVRRDLPTAEKIYSIFEPHTDLIKRGKVPTPVEFGHKVFLAESANGLITQYEVLDGNPVDERHVVPSLERHKQTFGHAPELYGSDRGFLGTPFNKAHFRGMHTQIPHHITRGAPIQMGAWLP